MIAPTVRAPWTEAQVREAIEDLQQGSRLFDVPEEVRDTLRALMDSDMARERVGWDHKFRPDADHPGTLWADLRAEETDELHTALEAAMAVAHRHFLGDLTDRVVAVALAFDEAHPDVPRGHWRPRAER